MALVQTLTGHTNYVWTSSFTLDNSHLVTCSSDETARVWDLAAGGTTASMLQHKLEYILLAVEAYIYLVPRL